MKVLVIRLSSIGDIILTTPVIRCLKTQVADVQVHYLTKPVNRAMLENNPHVNKVHVLSSLLQETIRELKNENFDFLIDLHHNLRSSIIKFRLGIKSFSFNKLNFQKWLLVRFKINVLPGVHIVDRYLETVRTLGVKNDGLGLDYFFSEEYELRALLPEAYQSGYIALVIGGQHATKRLPPLKLSELCNSLQHPVVLLGGPEDSKAAQLICSNTQNLLVYSACGRLSLDQSAFVVKQALHVITHDTGLMHIAAAFNKPITSVWGNTVPEFGMFPYRVHRSFIAEFKGLYCRPCSKIGFEKCPLGHFKCMNEQDMAIVAQTTVKADQGN